ncbi:MAG: GNAT family N-acetyltransferase [Planctomycetota bacterium]
MPETALPIMSRERVRRFEQVIGEAHRSSMRRSMAVDDNPQGIAFFEDGGWIGTLAANAPVATWMHEVYGVEFGEADEARLDRLLAFYKEHGATPRLRVVPDGFEARFADAMQARGLRHFGFHTVLYGVAERREQGFAEGVAVHRCETTEEARHAMRVMLEGFIGHAGPAEQVERVRRTWHEEPGFRTYLGLLDGEPAGAAMLAVEEDEALGRVGYLMMGAVKGDCRKRGVQAALIRARLNDAAELGCGLVLGGSDFESSSRQNQERAGLRIAYTAALWAPGPSGDREG